MIEPHTVARAVVRACDSKNPKPRYITGVSGKATVVARALLTDRMWERILMHELRN